MWDIRLAAWGLALLLKLYHEGCTEFIIPQNFSYLIFIHKTLSFFSFSRAFWYFFWIEFFSMDGVRTKPMVSDQIRSVAQSRPTLCNPGNRSTPGLPVHHQLPEFTQTHVHRVSDAIQPSHPLASPFRPALNPSQHQSFPMSQLFAWGGQSTGVSASASFLPKKSQGWSPLQLN